MTKKQIITIAGLPGSGKSSTAKAVAGKLGYEHFSSGDLFRKIGLEHGLNVEEVNFAAEKQQEIDREVDELLTKLGKEKEKLVIDSRLAFHWIPQSFKVFLDLDVQKAAERVYEQLQKEGRGPSQSAVASVGELRDLTAKRIESEKKRYHNLYQIDFTDKANYDLVVDTSANSLDAVTNLIVSAYQEWLR